MLVDFDEDMCLSAANVIRPGTPGNALKQLKKLKGSSGTFLARALIEKHQNWQDWPAPLKELIGKLDEEL
jgi:hypothetical protein